MRRKNCQGPVKMFPQLRPHNLIIGQLKSIRRGNGHEGSLDVFIQHIRLQGILPNDGDVGGINGTAAGTHFVFLGRSVDGVDGVPLFFELCEARPEEAAPANAGFVGEASGEELFAGFSGVGGVQDPNVLLAVQVEFDGGLDAEAVADVGLAVAADAIGGDGGGGFYLFGVVVVLGVFDGVVETLADVNNDTPVVEVLSLLRDLGVLFRELLEMRPGEGEGGLIVGQLGQFEHGCSFFGNFGDHCCTATAAAAVCGLGLSSIYEQLTFSPFRSLSLRHAGW